MLSTRSRKCVILNRTLILQFKTTLPGCVPSAGLYVSSAAVCNFARLCAWFIAIESGNPYFTKLHTVETWPNADQDCVATCGHLGTMGFNYWAQSKAVDEILDQYSVVMLHTSRPETGDCTPPCWFRAPPDLYFGRRASSNSISRLLKVT